MALPEQYITMTNLEEETTSTLVNSKRFVMFDEEKSRSASLEDIQDYIIGDVGNTVQQQGTQIQEIGSRLDNFADALEVDEDGLVYLLNNNERIAGPYGPFAGGGGGGGGGTNNAILTVTNTSGWLSRAVTEGANCPISFAWSSTEDDIPTGDGILTIKVNGSTRVNRSIAQGEIEIDVKEFLSFGANAIRVTVSDVYSNTKSINYTVSVVSLTIKSSFDATIPRSGPFTFSYTPTGNIQKTVYFIVDGNVIGTDSTSMSGRQLNYTIDIQSHTSHFHGSHSLLVYFESEVGGNIIRSNELYYDIICIDPNSRVPIIASNFRTTTTEQYTVLNIPYTVYTPNNLTSDVKLYVNDVEYSTQRVGRTTQVWSFRVNTVGELNLKIQTGLVSKVFNLTVTKSAVMAEVTTEDMVLGLQSLGRSNAEEKPNTWTYGDIKCRFDNFNFVSNGWVLDGQDTDEVRNTVLRINGNARLTIPYQPFVTNFRDTGKTIEIDFATRDVLNYDATIVSCMSGDRGFSLTTQKAVLKSAQSVVSTQYKEDEHVRISFVIEKQTENNNRPLFYIYINGIMSGVVQYPVGDDFSQITPVDITIGSNECTTDIYCIRIYDNSLTRNQILENWIADTQDVALMLKRYEHNNVYDEYGSIVIDKLPNDLPYLILSTPLLPQYKGNKINGVRGTYVDPTTPSKSFTFTGAQVDVQGTSSQFYARKNYKIKFKNGFDMTQSEEHVSAYPLNDGIPTETFTFKADVASSEGANNVELVRLYNEACPYKTPPQLENEKVRQGIDGFPIVMFWDNGSTVSFLGKYNWNNDKGTEEVFGFVEGDESWETLNNSGDYALWKESDYSITYIDSEGKTKYKWLSDFEARYPDLDDPYQDATKLSELSAWLVTTNQETATNEALSEPYTDDSGKVHTIDNVAYRLAKFHTEASEHFEMDSVLFMYLFTELFLMVDSRAKNAFPSFLGGDKWCFLPYDMDTAIGIDNRGELTFGYSLEDTDYIGTMPVFNGQDSVLWINVRDAFGAELQQMYKNIRSEGKISYSNIERMFEEHQEKWPEAIFNEDAWFKYIDPLLDDGNADYLPMALGSKAEQRKWWLYNRFRYIDSKYSAGDTMADTISMRPGAIDVGITITPYADIYAAVRWDNDTIKQRATHGIPVTIPCPYEQVGDNVIEILNASQLADVGDLSGFKPHRASFANAPRLRSIKIGSNTPGYTNPNLDTLTFGNNFLLKTVDARNCTVLGGTMELGQAINIEEIYFDGTIITGVTLPNGGVLRVLHLPETVSNLTLSNQPNITDLYLASYDNITTLVLENVPTLDLLDILNKVPTEAKIRLIGFNWEVNSAAEIDTIFNRLDSMQGGLSEANSSGARSDISTSQAVQGTIHISYLNGSQIAAYNERYPYITIDADTRECVVTYLNAVGEIEERETVYNGRHAQYTGQPRKASTAQYTYEFAGWSERNDNIPDPDAQSFILKDKTLYPCYTAITKDYTIRFVKSIEDGGGTLYTQFHVPYGEMPVYRGDPPRKDGDTEGEWEFYGWSPPLAPATGDMTYIAIFKDPSPMTRVLIARRPLEAFGSMSYVGSYAFGYCSQLNEVSFPNVSSIGASAFYACPSLTTVNIPNLTAIDSCGFAECNGLKSANFSNVTLMEREAFRGCYNLSSVNFPVLMSIPASAFEYCYNLTSVSFPEATIINDYAFGYCGLSSIELSNINTIRNRAFTGCDRLKVISFPAVTSVGSSVFSGCSALESVYLPRVSFIGNEAFATCDQLISINLPAVQTLGQSVFASCPNLINVSLSAISSIGAYAFADCYFLRSVYILTSSWFTLANVNAFENTPLSNTYQGDDGPGSIYVRPSLVGYFRGAAGWAEYADRITAYIE